ncbi:MAG: VWA domain-containing protein [Gammaproteobacteria bacterium]|nr:VWA domain-containing protein [Gammaproteobacteria bacterium]
MFEFELIWVLLFLPLPLLVKLILPSVENSTQALKVPFYQKWINLQQGTSTISKSRSKKIWILYFSWLLLIVAAAKPMWIGDPVSIPVSGRDLMLAVDLSGSMENTDFTIEGSQVDRLTAVKKVAGQFIERRIGDRIGLVLFGKRAYIQTPLTFDRTTVRYMLNEAEIGLAGKETAIGDGIGLAVKRLRERPEESRVLILLTDGANTAGEIEPLKAAELAKTVGLKIYTIGVGADVMEIQSFFGTRRVNPSTDLDEETLTKIAALTGGAYFRAKDTKGLEEIYQKLDEMEPTIQESETLRPEKALFYWPLGLCILLLVIYGFVSTRIGKTYVATSQSES